MPPIPAFLRPRSRRALVITCLVAAVPALLSVALAVQTVSIVASAVSMQSWPVVPATLQRVDLETQISRRNVRATASYVYDVGGRQYSGSRVSLYGGDNIGSFQRRAYEELKEHLARQAPYPVHVNPADPNQSILLPVLRWEIVGFSLLFILIFGAAGWGAIVLSYRSFTGTSGQLAATARGPMPPAVVDGESEEADLGPGWASEKAPARLAWGRRIMFVGVVLLGADFWLTDVWRTRSTDVLQRLLAEQTVATGEIRVSTVTDDRVQAAFKAAQAAKPAASTLAAPSTTAHGRSYEVRVTSARGGDPQPQLAALLAAFREEFGPSAPPDLWTYASPSALPLVTGKVTFRWWVVALGLLFTGGTLVAAGSFLAGTHLLTDLRRRASGGEAATPRRARRGGFPSGGLK
jgi:hypothetical protein